ncbi:MAG: transporter substrate-binding domain-containing protein [Rheinheimera sp.]|nr:transporter substrate-binding domain-containing protein [Rheinheimera sp.]
MPLQAKTVTVAAGAWGGMTAADGSGLYFQVLREALSGTDIELKVRVTNWKRAKQMFYANRADLLLADYRSNGNRQFFPQWHIDMDPPVVVFSLQPLLTADVLQGKTVGWMLGYEFGQFIPVPVDGVEVSAEQFGFDMLEYGRLDAFISYDSNVPQALKAKLKSLQLAPAQPLYPVFQNTFAGRQLAAEFDRGMLRLYQSGRLAQIYAAHFQQANFPALQR